MKETWGRIDVIINCMITEIRRLVLKEVKTLGPKFPMKFFADPRNKGAWGLPGIIERRALFLHKVHGFSDEDQSYYINTRWNFFLYYCRLRFFGRATRT